jgi:hypothetical protein
MRYVVEITDTALELIRAQVRYIASDFATEAVCPRVFNSLPLPFLKQRISHRWGTDEHG